MPFIILLFLFIIAGATIFGLMLVAGIMWWEGKWTLPRTQARELQKIQVERAREQWELEKLDLRFKQEQARVLTDDFLHRQWELEQQRTQQMRELGKG